MKRDLDLVRKIMLALEAEQVAPGMVEIEVEGYQQQQVHNHLTIMVEAKLVYGQEYSHESVDDTLWMYVRLTWHGHEFLDAARDEGRWAKLKESLKATGGCWTLGIVEELLAQSLRDALGDAGAQ